MFKKNTELVKMGVRKISRFQEIREIFSENLELKKKSYKRGLDRLVLMQQKISLDLPLSF